jgi:hypothetical protein
LLTDALEQLHLRRMKPLLAGHEGDERPDQAAVHEQRHRRPARQAVLAEQPGHRLAALGEVVDHHRLGAAPTPGALRGNGRSAVAAIVRPACRPATAFEDESVGVSYCTVATVAEQHLRRPLLHARQQLVELERTGDVMRHFQQRRAVAFLDAAPIGDVLRHADDAGDLAREVAQRFEVGQEVAQPRELIVLRVAVQGAAMRQARDRAGIAVAEVLRHGLAERIARPLRNGAQRAAGCRRDAQAAIGRPQHRRQLAEQQLEPARAVAQRVLGLPTRRHVAGIDHRAGDGGVVEGVLGDRLE